LRMKFKFSEVQTNYEPSHPCKSVVLDVSNTSNLFDTHCKEHDTSTELRQSTGKGTSTSRGSTVSTVNSWRTDATICLWLFNLLHF
ncbi:hypothetical protein STEG23_015348, partial [Scotinomys teguina]